jgi:propanol-preferring alcohol dehydrogenase
MKAMILERICDLDHERLPLRCVQLPDPEPGPGQIRLAVTACGVCHTELDEIEGRTPPPVFPVVPGHEVVGRVDRVGPGVTRFTAGMRVGVGWIHSSCGGPGENLSPAFRGTGRDVNGGYAEHMVVGEGYAYPIPEAYSDLEAAPLLCAGGVGYRALRLSGIRDGEPLGLTGFGASAHLVLQLARHLYPASPVAVFARDARGRDLAARLGAAWCGDTADRAPMPLAAIIDTTPAWKPVVEALANLAPGGRLVINAIRKEEADKRELLRIVYHDHLWMEREVKTVANITAGDIASFLPLAAKAGIRPRVESVPLERANEALVRLKRGGLAGALVLSVA